MIKAIIFDFDGVIGDTYNINFELAKFFDKEATEQDFKDHHNGNALEEPKIKFKPEDIEPFFEKQKQKFTKSHIFPLEEVISKLSKEYQLFIISSTTDENIRYFLELGNLNQFFEKIYGATTHTSKVEKFKMLFSQFNLNPRECVFITDTIGDIKEANKVNVKSIAVSWGYHDKKLLSKYNPLEIVHNEDELIQAVKNYKNK